jgi:hypothetical protein
MAETFTVVLSDRERATVLAALSALRSIALHERPDHLISLTTMFGGFESLSNDEIDQLAARLMSTRAETPEA